MPTGGKGGDPKFTEAEVGRFLRDAGFKGVEISIVHREEESPHFETLLAVGNK